MAFEYAGNMYGAAPFVLDRVQLAANCYVGQLVRADTNAGGSIEPIANAAAGPDTTSYILGMVTAIRTSPTYDSTFQGDLGTYDTTQATQVANDPVGPALADITVIRPGDKIKAPIVNATIGTALDLQTVTTGSADGLTFVANAITSSTSQYSTSYCRTGANRGQYRKVTTGNATTQTVLVGFTYDIAVGDTFVTAQCSMPGMPLHWDADSQFQAVDGDSAISNYYRGTTLELNLEESGREFIVFTINPVHLAWTV